MLLLLKNLPWLPPDLKSRAGSQPGLQGHFVAVYSSQGSEAERPSSFSPGWPELSPPITPGLPTSLRSWNALAQPTPAPPHITIQLTLVASQMLPKACYVLSALSYLPLCSITLHGREAVL